MLRPLEFRWSHVWHKWKSLPQDAQEGRPARPQRVKGRGCTLLGYVEGLSDARSLLADYFSILLQVRTSHDRHRALF
jgi:hypothetical protein